MGFSNGIADQSGYFVFPQANGSYTLESWSDKDRTYPLQYTFFVNKDAVNNLGTILLLYTSPQAYYIFIVNNEARAEEYFLSQYSSLTNTDIEKDFKVHLLNEDNGLRVNTKLKVISEDQALSFVKEIYGDEFAANFSF